MDIFLEFLKYGAIGIAMVLVVLSYRLLSKEQEKEHVREPMLKSIRTYFLLALAMTLFFGITEIVSLSVGTNAPNSIEDETKNELLSFLDEEIPDNAPHDSEKVTRTTEDYIRQGVNYPSLELKLEQADSLNDLINASKILVEEQLFNTAVTCLEILVNNDPTFSINIDFRGSEKTNHYDMLEIILSHENQFLDTNLDRRKRIRDAWVAYKKTFWIETEKNKLNYILPSDIKHLNSL